MDDLAQQLLTAIDSWAAPGSRLVVERLGPTWRRVRLGADGPQALNYRATPAAHQEPFVDNVSEEEVAFLRERIGRPGDVVYPYGRSNSKGALVRLRAAREIEAIRDVLLKRAGNAA